LTFHPHPLSVLRPERRLPLICSLREKLLLFSAFGIQKVLLQRFTLTFAQLSPEEFVRSYLVQTIGAEKVVVGHNVSFGRNRAGTADTLRQLAPTYGFAAEIVGPIKTDGQEVSSTTVRTLLSAGDMPAVTRFLGRRYTVSGRVIRGFQRGRTIGFPTANLPPRADLLLPNGVYAVRVDIDKQEVPGVANIGLNPTFGVNKRTLEVHLFNFSGDLYGRRLSVGFVERLRGEQKFPSVEELVKQIQKDADRARAILFASQP
jgi:riboflavin kinase/FMN adenylyltransferase